MQFGVPPRHPEGARNLPHPSENLDPPASDFASADQVEAVVRLHDQVVQALYALGMAVQSSSAGQPLPTELRGCVDKLTVVLDTAIRSAQLAAFEVPGITASYTVSGGPTGIAPAGETGARGESPG
jgi:hypothetical protein